MKEFVRGILTEKPKARTKITTEDSSLSSFQRQFIEAVKQDSALLLFKEPRTLEKVSHEQEATFDKAAIILQKLGIALQVLYNRPKSEAVCWNGNSVQFLFDGFEPGVSTLCLLTGRQEKTEKGLFSPKRPICNFAKFIIAPSITTYQYRNQLTSTDYSTCGLPFIKNDSNHELRFFVPGEIFGFKFSKNGREVSEIYYCNTCNTLENIDHIQFNIDYVTSILKFDSHTREITLSETRWKVGILRDRNITPYFWPPHVMKEEILLTLSPTGRFTNSKGVSDFNIEADLSNLVNKLPIEVLVQQPSGNFTHLEK